VEKDPERNLEDEKKEKEKEKEVVDDLVPNPNVINLSEASRLQVRKTRKPAVITLQVPALEERNAIFGILLCAGNGRQGHALTQRSARSSMQKNLSKNGWQPLLQKLRAKRKRKLKRKRK